MHDITEGGVLGALWEIATGSNVGFKVYQEKMPITPLTKKLCRIFNIDPLKFISSGSMLITTEKGDELIKILNNSGIKASIIGKIDKCNGILAGANYEKEVPSPKRDELFNLHTENMEENYEKINCGK